MRHFGRAAAAAAIFGALAVFAADATTVRRMSLGEIARRSSLVVVGTVEGTSTRLATAPGGRTRIFTDVDLVDLSVWKGSVPTENLVLSLVGGARHGRSLAVEGVPVLEPGRRYLLFLGEPDREPLCPILGWGQGMFPLEEGPGGSLLVRREDGAPVASVAGGEVSVDGPPLRVEDLLADLDRQGARGGPAAAGEKPR
jgi:hypothetical protein